MTCSNMTKILLKRTKNCVFHPSIHEEICCITLKGTRFMGKNDDDDLRVVLGWAYRGLTGGFLLLQNFSVAISVSPHVCFILVLILISMFLR